ncbi:MAG: hypothetical protein ACE5DK_09580, partial [Paracoccaceae bacterium]
RRLRNDLQGRFRAVALGDWKLIWTPFQPEDLAWELFEVGADPHETENLYAADHPEVPRLRAELEAWLARQDASEAMAPAEISEGDRQALRAMGYGD